MDRWIWYKKGDGKGMKRTKAVNDTIVFIRKVAGDMSFPVEQDVLRREMEGQMTEEERMVWNILGD